MRVISRIETDGTRNKAMDLERFSGDPEFMLSLAKGLVVLEACGSEMDCPTIAKLSTVTGLSRAAVRRCLYTLSRLGYAREVDGQGYAAKARLSTFIHTIHTNGLREELARAAQPILNSIQRNQRVCYSVTTLEADKTICIARTPTDPLTGTGKYLDTPLPAYCTAMGRLLVASLPPVSLESYLRSVVVTPFTGRTTKTVGRLRIALRLIRRRGFASCDQEYALGFRSVAVPIHLRSGKVVASLNASTYGSDLKVYQTEAIFVPQLRRAAAEFSSSL
jgi:IclR family transcriptional regulator, pca regulon regulatory protein